jgi:hypothetical protein
MTFISNIVSAPAAGFISLMIVGAVIFCSSDHHPGADRKGKEGLRSGRQHIIRHHRRDRAAAGYVHNLRLDCKISTRL